MLIMLAEAILLSLAGGALGWFGGHALNAALSPIVENQTGVPVHFWDLAPPEQIFSLLQPALGNSEFAAEIVKFQISPELLLIPGLILLAVLVGVYPAISAYRTDVAKSLGK
jgi:putative ABC transport system permease protein